MSNRPGKFELDGRESSFRLRMLFSLLLPQQRRRIVDRSRVALAWRFRVHGMFRVPPSAGEHGPGLSPTQQTVMNSCAVYPSDDCRRRV